MFEVPSGLKDARALSTITHLYIHRTSAARISTQRCHFPTHPQTYPRHFIPVLARVFASKLHVLPDNATMHTPPGHTLQLAKSWLADDLRNMAS